MKKKTLLILGILLVFFLAIQLVERPVSNPPVTHPIKAPSDVTAILQHACYDCHSNETKLSWYDKIAPVSWLVSKDVKVARSRFNLSTWDTLSPADQQGRVWEMVNMALTGKMPLGPYLSLHPQAKLSTEEIGILKAYAISGSPTHYHDSALISETEKELAGPRPSTKDLIAADGIRYIEGFQDWPVISVTNRFDNHSIRVVYGNAIIAKAIREGNTNPLPEGSTIVKVVWNSIEETNGDILPGSLNSVQIMTKDKKRFPDTKGWGFAKFNGIGLKPYGAEASFNTTCFNCHKIASPNDYVFNLPPDPDLYDAGNQQVITSFANRVQKTMSVLYGRTGEPSHLVTYRQTDNKYWFGSYINGTVLSVKTITNPDSAKAYPRSVFP